MPVSQKWTQRISDGTANSVRERGNSDVSHSPAYEVNFTKVRQEISLHFISNEDNRMLWFLSENIKINGLRARGGDGETEAITTRLCRIDFQKRSEQREESPEAGFNWLTKCGHAE